MSTLEIWIEGHATLVSYWRYSIIVVKLEAIHHLHCALDSGGDMDARL